MIIRSPGLAQQFAIIAQSKPTKKPAEITRQKSVENQLPQVVDNVKFDDISVVTFPPLTSAKSELPASTGADSKVEEIKSNPSRPVAELKPIVKENEITKEAVVEDDKTTVNNVKTNAKPIRKPKFQFKNNSSVIFLDELVTPNAAGTTVPPDSIDSQSQQANSLPNGSTDSKTALNSNGLNGIKFGFMDSSSSCEEDEPAVKTDTTVQVNQQQEDLSVKTNPRKPSNYLQAKKHLIKTTSNSSFKSGSSTKISSSHRTTTTTTTSTSSENEDAETRVMNHRKPKHKAAKKPAVNQKAKTSSSSFKSNNRKSSEDSSSNVDRLNVEAKVAASNNVNSLQAPSVYPVNGLGGTTLPTPPPPPQYIYYQNQLNQGYFAACYAAINPSNGAYMMPPPPLNFVPGNPYFPNQTMLPPVKPAAYYQLPAQATQEKIADSQPLNEQQVVTESSSLPPKEGQSSQSADSSNSTTPTPTTNPQDGPKETLAPQQPTVAPALVQLNPEYYPTPFGNLYKKFRKFFLKNLNR